MLITKKYGWSRRDFSYDCKCEGCGHVETNHSGYDDANYYENVVPDQRCTKCKESTNSMGKPVEPAELKYNPNQIV